MNSVNFVSCGDSDDILMFQPTQEQLVRKSLYSPDFCGRGKLIGVEGENPEMNYSIHFVFLVVPFQGL
jgi:hypothetical protein